MNFNKLSKYFSGKFPNSEKIDISEFVKILGNIDIEGDFLSIYGTKFGSIKTDYDSLFNDIYLSEKGENKIYKILKYFELSKKFLEIINFDNPLFFENNEYYNLKEVKKDLLDKFNSKLKDLKKDKNNKLNGDNFEELCEAFLLHTSYFEPGIKEFRFQDGTERIDRLLRLKKDIGNFGKDTNYLGYVILEAKYKKDGKNSAGEVSQLKSYIERLHKHGVSKYAIVITATKFKKTYEEKIGDYCKEKVISKENPFYLSLITAEDIVVFLGNNGDYKDMTFDDFIERSFIKWLK